MHPTALSIGLSASQGALYSALFNVASGFGRIAFGYLADSAVGVSGLMLSCGPGLKLDPEYQLLDVQHTHNCLECNVGVAKRHRTTADHTVGTYALT